MCLFLLKRFEGFLVGLFLKAWLIVTAITLILGVKDFVTRYDYFILGIYIGVISALTFAELFRDYEKRKFKRLVKIKMSPELLEKLSEDERWHRLLRGKNDPDK